MKRIAHITHLATHRIQLQNVSKPDRFRRFTKLLSVGRPHENSSYIQNKAPCRIGRLMRFTAVGALGTVINLSIMALLVHGVFKVDYLVAAVIAAEISILHNFVLQERFVFVEGRVGGKGTRSRLIQHLLYNNAEALMRIPFLMLLVETAHVMAILAQTLTLAAAFVARFVFVSHVVYGPRPSIGAAHRAAADSSDEVAA